MPPEIADSDAESDLDSPRKRILRAPADLTKVALSSYDFDQFLDPTSSHASPGGCDWNGTAVAYGDTSSAPLATLKPSRSPRGDHATDMSPSSRSRKRVHTTGHDSTELQIDGFSDGPKSKKQKRHDKHASPPEVHAVDPTHTATTNYAIGETIDGARHWSESLVSPDDRGSRGPSHSFSTTTLHSANAVSSPWQTTARHRLTTAPASVGGYESINLDFRGLGQGMDVNSNPFGSLSQLSTRDDAQFQGEPPIAADLLPPADSSPNQPACIEPVRPAPTDDAGVATVPEDRSRECVTAGSISIQEPAGGNPSRIRELPPSRKRGSKAKFSTAASQTPPPGETAELEDVPAPLLRGIQRSRQGTVDSVSHASETSERAQSTKKRIRRTSKHIPDHGEGAMHSSDISPAKEPTSDLNLSDEAVVGLPKETYNPRPSRSRAKKLVEDVVVPPQSTRDDEQEHHTPVKAQRGADPPDDEPSVAASTRPSGRKGRKSKVKRAKTSAAALLQKSAPMLSDGEEDVVWLDTKPAPVTLDLPPDLGSLKRETRDLKEVEEGSKTATDTENKISIEIPRAAATEDNTKPAPKKRGRKPKKSVQWPEPESAKGEHDEPAQGRPPLAEKSTNTPSALDHSQPDAHGTITDIKPPVSPEKKSQEAAPNANELVRSTHPTTPSKVSTTEKGPAKHSPINPPNANLSGGKKAIYRVGLSRRQHIPSLLRKVQRDKPPPKVVVRKEPKKKTDPDLAGDSDQEARDETRGADGMLVEWDD